MIISYGHLYKLRLLKSNDNEQGERHDFEKIVDLFKKIITPQNCLLALFPKAFT